MTERIDGAGKLNRADPSDGRRGQGGSGGAGVMRLCSSSVG